MTVVAQRPAHADEVNGGENREDAHQGREQDQIRRRDRSHQDEEPVERDGPDGEDPEGVREPSDRVHPDHLLGRGKVRINCSYRTTRNVPARSSATPAIRVAPRGVRSSPRIPRRSMITDAASCPVIVAAATPPAPIDLTALSA